MGSEAITIALSSALVGAAAGGLGALLMALISWGSQLGWGHAVTAGFPTTAPMAIRLTLPLLAGLAIGWLRRRGAAPLPELHTTLEELHEQGAVKIQPRGSHLLLGLLALLGGGSLGPEALLSRALAEWSLGLSRWRWLKAMPWKAACAISGGLGLFGLPLIGGVALAERPERPLPSGIWRWLPGLTSGIAGFAVFQGFSRFGVGEQGVPYTWPADGQQLLVHLLWALVLGAVGGGLGLLFISWRRWSTTLLSRWQQGPMAKAMLGASVLSAMAVLMPLTLFSGEQQITPLLRGELEISGLTMVLIGLFKLLVCGLCLSCGWIGGLFFPLIFSAAAIAQGLALCWPDVIPAQVAVSTMASAIQSAVLGQALLPLLITAGVLKGHAMAGVMLGSVMGLGVRQITLAAKTA